MCKDKYGYETELGKWGYDKNKKSGVLFAKSAINESSINEHTREEISFHSYASYVSFTWLGNYA